MFNWVCPQCGKEVPPSKTECPYCASAASQQPGYPGAAPGQYPPQGWAPQAPVPPAYAPPVSASYPPPAPAAYTPPAPAASQGWSQQAPQAWQPPAPAATPQPTSWQPPPPPQTWQPAPPAPTPPPPQQYAPAAPVQPPVPQYAPAPAVQPPVPHPQQAWQPPPAAGTPTWVMGVGFFAVFAVLLACVYFSVQYFGHSTPTNPAEKTSADSASNASQQKVTNPLEKYVEVVGIRLTTDKDKKPVAKFLVVNHSGSEIAGLDANVTLWASSSRSDEDSVGSFSFKGANVPASGSTELSAPLKTKLKPYELPDWQKASAEIQITSPQP